MLAAFFFLIYFLHFFFELKHLDSSISAPVEEVAHHSVFAETGEIAKIKPKFKIIAKSERMISVFKEKVFTHSRTTVNIIY